MDLLERTKKFNVEWVKAGHRKGAIQIMFQLQFQLNKMNGISWRMDVEK